MTKDEVVDVGMCDKVALGILHKIFLVLAQIRWIAAFVAVFQAAVLGPTKTEANPPPWMNASKKPLANRIVEDRAKQTKLAAGVTQSVAMSKQEYLVAQLDGYRFGMHNHSTLLLEIILAPHIVVTREEVHLDAHVCQFANLAKDSGVPLRHHILVLVPEVEDIAQEIDGLRLILNLVKESHQPAFLLPCMRNGLTAQMGIGKEIYVFHFLLCGFKVC